MFLTVFVVMAILMSVVWAPFVYCMFFAGRFGPTFRVSPDGTEHTCGAALYVGKMRPTLPQVKLVATSEWITAYAPLSRKAAYKRGHRGLADASMFTCRAHASQIREISSIGIGNGVKITDVGGNSVYLYGRGVPGTLSILGSGYVASGGHPHF